MTVTAPARRSLPLLVFLPLLVLLAAAFLANAGIKLAAPANAAAVTVSSAVSAGTWSASDSCGSTISPPVSSNMQSFAGGTCDVTFGITNATSNMFLVGDAAFWTEGGGFYTATASNCTTNLGLQKFGFKVGSTNLTATVSGGGCAAENAPANGVADAANGTMWRPINTTPVQVCASPTNGTKVCPIVFGVQGHTSTPPTAATYDGTLTFTAT